MKAIVDKHIAACVAELRTAVAREFAQAIAALTPADKRAKRSPPRRKPAAAPIPPTPAPRAAKPDRAASAKPAASTATSSRRTCGCGPVGRHRRECAQAKAAPEISAAPRAPKVGNGTDSPHVKAPVDTGRAARFAAIEASAQKRTGAHA